MTDLQAKIEIEQLGTLRFYLNQNFDAALADLKGEGGSIITVEELVYAQMQREPYHVLSRRDIFVQEGCLFGPGEKQIYLLRNPLVLRHPAEASKRNKTSLRYVLGQSFNVQEYLEQLHKDAYFVLDDLDPIPTKNFSKDQRTLWLFGKQADDYGRKLNGMGIEKFTFKLHPSQQSSPRPYLYQLVLSQLTGSLIETSTENYPYVYVLGVFKTKQQAKQKDTQNKVIIRRPIGINPNLLRLMSIEKKLD